MLTDVYIDILIAVGEKGGVETVVNKNALYLQQQGFRVRVVQLVWEGVRWVSESIPFYSLLEGRGSYTIDQFVLQYSDFLSTHEKPDVILATAWPMMSLVAKMTVMNLRPECKIVSWLHGPIDRYADAGFGGVECLKAADKIFVLNEKTRSIIHAYDKTLDAVIVKNPVDFTRCRIHSGDGGNERTLLFVGRLSAEKRIEVILYAISYAKEKWQLKIIGDGEERSRLEQLAASLHLEGQVFFAGWQPNPWEYAKDVSALVLASAYEAFPVAAIESLASGIPVISTPVDGIIELIRPGVNGFLFPQGGSAELADILDGISSKKLPPTDSAVCRETVAAYEEQSVLLDFKEKLEHALDKISIIIPCYNVEKQIARCLDSILNQKLRGASIEILCIDDKSTDDTLQILEHYESRYPDNFLLIPLDENRKQGNARNVGMLYAGGNYITFIDADDIIAPEMLQQLYGKAVQSHCDIVECAYKEVRTTDSLSVEERGVFEHMDMRDKECKKEYILRYGWKTGPWGRLYRRDFLTDNQISFPADVYMEDIFFSEHCMLCMKSYVRIPYTYYFYCINEAGVMCSDKMINYYMDTAKVQNKITEFAMNRQMITDCRDEFAYLHFSKAFVEPVRRMCRDNNYFSYDHFQYLKESLFQLFPDFLQNPYMMRDNSSQMQLYKQLLQETYSEQELYNVLYR